MINADYLQAPTQDTWVYRWRDPTGKERVRVTFRVRAYRLGLWDSTYEIEADGKSVGCYDWSQSIPIAKMKAVEILKKEFKAEYKQLLEMNPEGSRA